MDKAIAWWARNPVAANLLMIGILLAGFLGFMSMQRETFPAFRPNLVSIDVTWPGAAPQEVEEQIVNRLEQALKNVSGVYQTSSTSQESHAHINVRAQPSVNMQRFVDEIKGTVDSVNGLPPDIEKPDVKRVIYRNEMIRVAVHGKVGEHALTRLAKDLRDQVAQLPYISIVQLFGIRAEEVSVELSEENMQ
ncbi:MAG TPA: efflux RND transporter permease subunit, partial [Pseudomonadales bacterium]|nr:efflux RND transporter permease subunit [Pseudomonadales bacterium]